MSPDSELDRLNNILQSHTAMGASMLDGYLAAVASGPNLVMPDQMLRWIWDTENGEQAPEFKDHAARARSSG